VRSGKEEKRGIGKGGEKRSSRVKRGKKRGGNKVPSSNGIAQARGEGRSLKEMGKGEKPTNCIIGGGKRGQHYGNTQKKKKTFEEKKKDRRFRAQGKRGKERKEKTLSCGRGCTRRTGGKKPCFGRRKKKGVQ